MMCMIETHAHTKSSPCGILSGAELANIYKQLNYSILSISDHYAGYFLDRMANLPWDKVMDVYLTGYHEAKKQGDKIGLTVFLSAELLCDENRCEFLLVGITEKFLRENQRLHQLPFLELVSLLHKNDALIFQAHPFRGSFLPQAGCDGYEVYNGCNQREENQKAFEYARKKGVLMLSGSDIHSPVRAGAGGIKGDFRPQSEGEFVSLLKRSNFNFLMRKENKFSSKS